MHSVNENAVPYPHNGCRLLFGQSGTPLNCQVINSNRFEAFAVIFRQFICFRRARRVEMPMSWQKVSAKKRPFPVSYVVVHKRVEAPDGETPL